MVDNQHKKIKGYRDLTEDEIALMNEVKELSAKCGELVDKLTFMYDDTDIRNFDQRWLAIGKTDLQKGFMAVVRAIAKPETF